MNDRMKNTTLILDGLSESANISKLQKELDIIKFTKNGDSLKDMDNVESLFDILDSLPNGVSIKIADSKYGSTGYQKLSNKVWVYDASGLYGEAGGVGRRYHTEEVIDKLIVSITKGNKYKIVE